MIGRLEEVGDAVVADEDPLDGPMMSSWVSLAELRMRWLGAENLTTCAALSSSSAVSGQVF